MMKHEKERILEHLRARERWCRNAEARDRNGRAVHFDDPAATAWDLTGAICLLFGWPRALELFPQIDRHLNGRKRPGKRPHCLQSSDPQIVSMVAVQEYNDQTDVTHEAIIAQLEAMPVYQPTHHARVAVPE